MVRCFFDEGLYQAIEDFDLPTFIYNNNTMPFFAVYATPECFFEIRLKLPEQLRQAVSKVNHNFICHLRVSTLVKV